VGEPDFACNVRTAFAVQETTRKLRQQVAETRAAERVFDSVVWRAAWFIGSRPEEKLATLQVGLGVAGLIGQFDSQSY
jgi:hypothetical protein